MPSPQAAAANYLVGKGAFTLRASGQSRKYWLVGESRWMRCLPDSSDSESGSPPPLLHIVSVLIFNRMVEYQSVTLDRVYAALADPTRRAILSRLTQQEARVTELAEPFTMSLNAVSKHVRILEEAGLIQRNVQGRDHYLSLDATPLQEAAAWIETYRQFWTNRLNRLESFLQQKQKKHKRKRIR
jgi:DNA-binding transcriptional ArsR family regulator